MLIRSRKAWRLPPISPWKRRFSLSGAFGDPKPLLDAWMELYGPPLVTPVDQRSIPSSEAGAIMPSQFRCSSPFLLWLIIFSFVSLSISKPVVARTCGEKKKNKVSIENVVVFWIPYIMIKIRLVLSRKSWLRLRWYDWSKKQIHWTD